MRPSTPGGGGGGDSQSKRSKTHLPRVTGEVRVGVSQSKPPSIITPHDGDVVTRSINRLRKVTFDTVVFSEPLVDKGIVCGK